MYSFYLGLLPDLATARDNMPEGRRKQLYTYLSLGWTGHYEQWRHYARAYVALAALVTPLVISVHSIVSWDFAMSVLHGWHTTIFAPYFVAGAIHSGLAMVILLLIPLVNVVVGVMMWAKICIARKKSPWLVILMFVPIANLVFVPYLAFSE
jgi:Ni/Fe-hydrogenase subunit HybB-like protein